MCSPGGPSRTGPQAVLGGSDSAVEPRRVAGGAAEISASGVITLAGPDMPTHYGNVAPQHRVNMTGWVNQFNDRSRRVGEEAGEP